MSEDLERERMICAPACNTREEVIELLGSRDWTAQERYGIKVTYFCLLYGSSEDET
jgi:hypothetical protein